MPRVEGVECPRVRFEPEEYSRAKEVIFATEAPMWFNAGVCLIGDAHLEALDKSGVKYELVSSSRKK